MTPLILQITASLIGAYSPSDGDSGRLTTADGARHRIRLHSLDAGEVAPFTRCRSQPAIWACSAPATAIGPAATRRARELSRGPVACSPVDTDRYGRIVAVCRVGGVDIGAVLVREGLARSEPDYGNAYAREEAAARREGRGVWE